MNWIKKISRSAFIFSVFLGAISGCNPEDFELPAWQAEFFLPIVDAQFDINDITLTDVEITEDSTGLVILVYEVTDSRTLEELFPFEDETEDFTIPGIPGATPDFSVDVPLSATLLGVPVGTYPQFDPLVLNEQVSVDFTEFFQEAEFNTGQISLSLTNQFPFVLDPGMIFRLVNQGAGSPVIVFTTTQSINPGQTILLPVQDLSNLLLTGSISLELQNFSTQGGSNLTVLESDALEMSFSFTNVSYTRAVVNLQGVPLPGVTADVPLQVPNGALLQNISLDSGFLEVSVPELDLDAFTLEVKVLSAIQNDDTLTFSLNTSQMGISLQDLDLDLTSTNPPYNQMVFEFQLVKNDPSAFVEVFFDTPLQGEIGLSSIDYHILEGYLGTGEETLGGEVEIDLFSRIDTGEIVFQDPRIIMDIQNSQGLQATFQDDGQGLYIKGRNPDLFGQTEVEIGQALNGFTIVASPMLGEQESSTLRLDEMTEPNFNEFMGLLPVIMDVRAPFIWGTATQDFNQFLLDTGRIEVSTRLELPLEFSANNLILTDTIEYSNTEFEQVEVTSAIFFSEVTSLFPLELRLQTYFLGPENELIDSLFQESVIIEPAEIDANGDVIEPLVAEFTVEVSPEKLDRIQSAAFTVPRFRLETPDNQVIRFLSSYTAHLKITGRIVLDVDLN